MIEIEGKGMQTEVSLTTAGRWRTLSRRDPEFLDWLDGGFSDTHRALPVHSLNVGAVSEEVTFEIVPVAEIPRPSLARLSWLLMRPPTLTLSVGPMLTTLLYCMANDLRIVSAIAVSSFIGVVLFQVSLNLFNDYFDHIRGQDRLKAKGGSRAIQKGWVRARDVKTAAWGLMGLAILFGVPAVALNFSPVAIVAFLALLAGLEFALQRLGLKYRGFGEIMAFAMTGPLLTCGYAWAISGGFEPGFVALGCVFGAISLMYFHLANFENIMSDSQAGVVTWATRTGFDASKRFFHFTAFLTVAAMVAFIALFERPWILLPVLGVQLFLLIQVGARVRRLASPLSSELVGLRSKALELSWITVAAFAMCYAVLWMSFHRGGVTG